ncbi:MAG: hypothetical protein AAF902_23630 [Chloroflexota bacterium]
MNTRSAFRHSILLACLLFCLGSCSEAEPEPLVAVESPTPKVAPTLTQTATATQPRPTATPLGTAVPTATSIPVWFEGVFVDLPEGLGTIELSEEAPNVLTDVEQYVLNDWPANSSNVQPVILAFSRFDLASTDVGVQLEIERLQSLTEENVDENVDLEDVDDLPEINLDRPVAALITLPAFQSFENGLGLRYIVWRPTEKKADQPLELMYVWHGLTDDGRGVLTAEFPVEVDGLPRSSNANPDFEDWTARIADAIEDAAPEQFMPPLAQIDKLVGSIDARIPRPELLFDENGKVDLTIVYPRDKAETLIGRQLQIEGYLQPGPERQVDILLVSNNNSLAGQSVLSDLDGWWRATLDIPANLQGMTELIVVANDQTDQIQLELRPDPIGQTQNIEIVRPLVGAEHFAGSPIFVDGRLGDVNLVDDLLRVGLRTNGCQTPVARQTLNLLPTDKYWHVELMIPEQISGDACVVAFTGSYGQSAWREVQLPIVITDLDQQETGLQIAIGNSTLKPIRPNTSVTLFGAIIGPFEENESAVVSLRSNDGAVLDESTVKVEAGSGRWSAPFQIPSDIPDTLVIHVSLLSDPSIQAELSLAVSVPRSTNP